MEWFRRHFRTIYQGIKGLPAGLRTALLAGSVVILVVLFLTGFRFYSYTQNNPQFCLSCHLMAQPYELWQTSEHKSVNCHSCHEASIKSSLSQVYEQVTKHPTTITKHAVVPSTACQSCHTGKGPTGAKDITGTNVHIIHADKQKLECTQCHSTSLHRFEAPENICQKCHQANFQGGDKAEKIAGMQNLKCSSCHDLLGKSGALVPTRATCITCHAQAPKTGLHAAVQMHAQSDCYVCHKPHVEPAPSRATCQTCHTDRQNHFPGIVCRTCHSFTTGGGD